MIVYVMAKSASSFGCNTTFSLVGDYLEDNLGSYGDKFNQLEVTACFRGDRGRHPTLQRSHSEYHNAFLPTLPLLKLFRKKGRIDIQYETKIADASFLERYGFLSAEVFARAMREVADALHHMDEKLRKNDFDLSRFHTDVSELAANAPTSDAELRSLRVDLERKAAERRAAMDPWESLDIDWDEFHPQARRLLDDPFFWSMSDGYSPHGNDTGADLLSDFKKWNLRHPKAPAHELANSLLRAWGIPPMDLSVVEEERVKEFLQHDGIALSVNDDAIVAAAFAAIKLRGYCDLETKRLATAALERERLECTVADRGWKDSAERLRTLDVLSQALARSPDAVVA